MKNIIIFLSLILSVMFASSLAQAQFGPQLTYHGRILDTSVVPPVAVLGNVQFLIQVVHPTDSTCVLYQEVQTQNLTAADGNFVLTINGGVPIAADFGDVFATDSNATLTCINNGTTYAGLPDMRKLNVYFVPPGFTNYEPLPTQTISYVPMAIEALNARTVGGFDASSLLRVASVSGSPITVPALTQGLYDELYDTITGNSSYYVLPTGTVTNFSGTLSGEVTGTQSATVVSRILGQNLTLAGSTFVSGAVLTYDGTNWRSIPGTGGTVQSVTSSNAYLTIGGTPNINPILTVNVGTASGTVAAGNDSRIVNAFQTTTPLVGDVTGTVAATNVSTVGGRTAAQVATSVADTIAATAAPTANTIAKRDATGGVSFSAVNVTNTLSANAVTANSLTGRTLNMFDTSSPARFATITTPSVLATSYTLTLPQTAPVSGFVLGTNAVGILSWVSPLAGAVTSVSGAAPLSSTGGTTPVISISQANLTTNGFLSAADFVTFNNKVTSVSSTSPITVGGTTSSPVIGLAASGVTSGTYTKVIVDTFGRVTSATTLVSGDIPNLDASKITTGTLPVARGGTGAGSFTSNGFVYVASGAASLASTGCLSSQVPYYNGTTWVCISAQSANASNTLVMRDTNGDFTANNITTIQDLTVQRNLRVQDGSVGGFVQLSVPIALGTSYTLELPRLSGAYGFAGQSLAIDTVIGNTFTTRWIDTLPNTLVSGSIFVGNTSGAAQARAMTGDATLDNAGVLTLTSVGAGVTSGSTYTKVTVDGKGRVTSGALINFSDVSTALGYSPVASVSTTAPITLTGTASAPVIGLANSGVLAATYPKVTVDIFGRVTSGSVLNFADVTTGLGYTPYNQATPLAGDVTGTVSTTVVSFVGGKTSAQVSQSVSDTIAATSLNVSNTIVKRDSNGDFTANNITTIQDLTVQRNLRVQDGSVGGFVQLSVPIALGTSYTLELPRLSGAYGFAGQSLAIDTVIGNTFTTRWIDTLPNTLVSGSIFVGNTSGAAQARALTGDASLSNTGVLTLSPIGAGVTSGSTYTKVTVDGKGRVTSGALINFSDVTSGLGYTPAALPTASSPIVITGTASSSVISLAASGIAPGTYPKVTVDIYGRVTSGSVLNFADVTTGLGYTPYNQATPLAGDVTGPVSATVVSFVGGKTSAQVSQSVSDTIAATSLPVSNTLIKRDATGSFVAYNITTVNNMTVQGSLGVQDGTVGGVLGLRVPVGFTTYNLTFPASAGTAGQVLGTSGGAGLLSWLDVLTTNLASGSILVGNASGTSQARTLTGDASLSNTGVLTLTSVGAGVTSGSTYTKVTVDGKGRVTSGALINFSDVSTALGYSPVASVSTTAPITLTGTASAPVIGLANSGVLAATYPKVTVDIFGRVTSGSVLNFADVTTGLGYTPYNQATPLAGDVTGTVSTTVVSFVGGKTSAQVSQSVSDTLAATNLPVSNTLVKRDANGDFIANNITTVNDMTVQGDLVVQDGTSGGTLGLRVPVGFSSYNLTFPVDDGTTGQVLSTNGTGLLSWVGALTDILASGSIIVGNSSGTAQARSMTGDASISNTGVLTLSPIGAGVTSGSQYTKVTVDGKGRVTSGTQLTAADVTTALTYIPVQSVSATAPITIGGTAQNPIVGLAVTGVTSGTYPKVSVDTFGRVTSGSNLSFTDVTTGLGYTPYNQATPLAGDVTGTVSTTVVSFVGGKTSAQVSQSVSDTLTATSLNVSNTIVKRDATGSFTAYNITTVNNMTVQGSLGVQDGTVGGVLGLRVPVGFSTYNLTFPASAGATGQVLGTSGAGGILSWLDIVSANLASGSIYIGNASGSAQARSMTGDASLSNTGVLTLSSIGSGVVSGNQYTKVTVDGKGRVTSGTQLTASDITTALTYVPVQSVSSTTPITIGGTAQNPIVGLAVTGVTSGTYPKVSVDTFGRVTSGSNLSLTDITNGLGYIPYNSAGGTMTGNLNMGGNSIVSAGVITMVANSYLGIGQYAVDPSTVGWGTAQAGYTWFNTTTNILKYWNGSSIQILASGSSAISSLNGLTNVTQIFATGTAGTSFGISSAGSTHTFNIPLANTAAVTAGLLSNTDYVSFNNKVTAVSGVAGQIAITGTTSSPVVGLATTGVAATTYPKVTVDIYGRVTSGTNLVAADIPNLDAGKITSGILPVTFGGTGAVSFTANALIMSNGTGTALSGVTCAPNQVMYWTGATWTCGTVSTALGYTPVASVTATAPLLVTGTASAPNISLANSGVIAATYPKVTVDAFGRVTSGTTLNFADVTTGLGYTPGGTPTGSSPVVVTGPASAPVISLAGVGAGVSSGTQYTKVTVDGFGRVTSGAQLTASDITTTLTYTPVQSVSVTARLSLGGTAQNPIIDLGNSGVTAAAYPKVTVDVYGRVTSGSNLTFTDVTTGLGYSPVASVSSTSPITITGTASAPIVGLATSGVTSGTYPKVSVDIYGRITSGSSLTLADITTGLGYTPYNSTAGLQGDVTGFVSATVVSFVGGKTSAQVSQSVSDTLTATDANNVSTIVKRDGSGNFIAGQGTFNTSVRVRDGAAGGIVTLAAPTTFTSYNLTLPVSAGTSGQVLSTNGTGTLSWLNVLSTNLTNGSILIGNGSGVASAVAMTGDATLANTGVLTLSSVGAGVSSGSQYTKVTVDAKGRVVSGANLNASDVTTALTYTPLNRAGDTMSGNITMAGNAIVSAGAITMVANSYLGLGQYAVDPLIGTLQKGYTWFNSTSNQMKYFDGTAIQILASAGTGLTSLNGLTNVTQTFATGTAGTSFGISSAGSTHTFNIPLANTAAVTAGLLSNTDYVSFNNKVSTVSGVAGQIAITGTSSSPVVGLATTGVAATTYPKVTVDIYGRVTSGTNLVAADIPNLDAAKITTGFFPISQGGTGATSFTANSIIVASGTALAGITCATSEILYWNGTRWTCGTVAASLGYSPVASVTATAPLLVTGTASAPNISLANSGVIAATYPKVTVDAFGRVTSGTTLNFADVTTGLGYTPGGTPTGSSPVVVTGPASAPVISLAGVGAGVSSGTQYTKVTVDGFGRVTSGSSLTLADITTALTFTPFNPATALVGDVTGFVSATVVSFVGGKTSAQVSQSVSDTINATDLNTVSTIVKRDGSGNFTAGQGTFNSSVRVRDGAAGGIVTLAAPTTFTSYNLTLPVSAGTSGQVLSTNGTGTLSWLNVLSASLSSGTIYVGNASGVASAVAVTGDATLTNTGSFTLSSVGAGVTSGSQYTKVTVDGKGRVTSGTNLVAADIPNLDAAKITTGIFPISQGGTGVSTFTANSLIVASGTTLAGITCAVNEVVYWNGTRWTCGTAAVSLGYTPVASVTASSPLVITGTASAPNVSLANSGVTSASYGSSTAIPIFSVDAFGRITSASSTAYTDATAGVKGIVQIGSNITVTTGTISITSANVTTAIGAQASGTFYAGPLSGAAALPSFRSIASTDLPITGATGVFVNGGNSFGTTGTVGTNDPNNLVLETNNIARVTVDTNGGVQVTGQAWSTVQTSTTVTNSITFDANSGNTIRWTTGDATATAKAIQLNNVKPGAAYSVILIGGTGQATITCFSDNGVTSLGASSYIPANGARSTGLYNKTVYTIISDGEDCMITWITGF